MRIRSEDCKHHSMKHCVIAMHLFWLVLFLWNSVYQAELVAIRNSLIHLFTLPIRECFSKINIYSDSLSSLNSIDDCEPRNSLVKEIHKYIRFFSKFTEVQLAWCKGHVKILGNELADYFAKDAVSNPLTPTEELSLPISHLKDTIRKKSKSMLTKRWEQSENGRITHDFIPSETPQHVYENNSHKMTQILTGHCRLKFFLNSIGKSLNPVCDCGLAIETVPHYLFYCPFENENRANTLIKTCFQLGLSFPPNPAALISNKVLYCSLQSFLSRSSRLNFSWFYLFLFTFHLLPVMISNTVNLNIVKCFNSALWFYGSKISDATCHINNLITIKKNEKKIINFKNPKRYLYIVIYLITNETKMITKNNNNNIKKKHCI